MPKEPIAFPLCLTGLSLLGGLGGLVPAFVLMLGNLSPLRAVLYAVAVFASSAGVVVGGFWALERAPRWRPLAYGVAMVALGALNGAFAAFAQVLLSRSRWLAHGDAPAAALVGLFIGTLVGGFYALLFAPAAWGVRWARRQPVRAPGAWLAMAVGGTGVFGGLVVLALFAEQPLGGGTTHVVSGAVVVGSAVLSSLAGVRAAWWRRQGERVALSEVADGAELPLLDPFVRLPASHVLVRRVAVSDAGPYREGELGQAWARLN